MPGTAGSEDKSDNPGGGAPTPVTATAPASDAPSATATGQSPTPHPKPRSAMAVEPIEYDDFGLPVKKYVPPTPVEAPSDTETPAPAPASRKTSLSVRKASIDAKKTPDAASQDSSAPPRQAGKKDDDTDSPSDEEFKDAVSAPESETASRAGGDEAPEKQQVAAAAARKPTETPPPTAQPDATARPNDAEPKTAVASEAAKDAPESQAAPGGKPPAEEDKAVSAAKDSDTTKPDQQHHGPDHARMRSDASAAAGVAAVSEFSHQQLTAKQPEKAEADDGEWQVMPAYAPYDIYDDDNKLVAKEYTEEEEQQKKYDYGGLGGAGKGYTRVFLDDDAESVTSMDDNTQYLFKDKGLSTAVTEEDDAQRDAVSQLQATKELLTEGQRIAYVGITRLELSAMLKELENIKHTRRTKKELAIAAESMQMWGQKMMVRLYSHMDISPAEQIMIEQLTAHGVVPSDLTPVLMANARVKNPMAEEESNEKKPSTDRSHGSASGSAKSSRPTSVASTDGELPATPPPPYDVHGDAELSTPVKMPSQMPTTEKIDIDIRWTVLCDLFLVLIADSIYDSRSRVLLERVSKDLEIPWLDICRFEKKVTDALEMQQQAEKENWNEEEHMETRRKMDLKRRYIVMGLATVGGGLVIGLSAGLLAPLIGAGLAAGFTTIGVGGTSTFLAGAGGAAIITSSAATSGSIIGVRAANRRTGSVKTFEYRPLHNNKRVNLIITISGWMTGKVDDVRLPYSTVDPIMGDLYSVLWEPEMLTSMGDTINILATEALTQGLQQVLGSTVLVTLMAALQLPVVLTKLSYLIDNPWTVSLDRATMAGLILADSLIDRNLGTRPVTLVGYSLGSRVIFSCLQELAKKGAYGLVQNVYLFGSPVVVKQDEYLRARGVVSGRFLNAYNRNDWILGYLFRLTNGGIRRVAGLAPIEDIPGLENMDVSEFVNGHMDYRRAMPRLLRECGWSVESDEFTEIEDPDPENHQTRQRELINEIEEARRELEKEQKEGKGSKGAFGFFRKKKAAAKQEWEVYEDSNKAGAFGSKTEDKDGNNHGVLFDVDAIRAELAKDQRDKKNEQVDEELFQVREIKSTLPPMKLELSPTPPPPPAPVRSPRDSLRGSRSADTVPYRVSGEYRSSNEHRSTHSRKVSHQRQPSASHRVSSERTPTFPSTKTESSSYYQQSGNGAGASDEIQMTFDTSFDEPKPQTTIPTPPPYVQSHKESLAASHHRKPSTSAAPARPEVKSAQTVPNITLTDPWANYDDDEDFGKEKEISMTFA
ncbi:hypothetical protein B0T16DRAFT_451706 [Cercophora newfieldiana]|uniref:DUF726-domain-containing protein n=1 Tax=Cercophora newfieldiana TaxID=92897 RepID=A0AA40CZC3_9PEZI|nr:hypothetical protein B0T16DRAFT_451706 [Cercophora newfieldiana]